MKEKEKKENFALTLPENRIIASNIISIGNYDVYISDRAINKPEYIEYSGGNKGVVQWGSDNLFPQHLIDIEKNVSLHGACCQRISDMVATPFVIPTNTSQQYLKFLQNEGGDYNMYETMARMSYDLNLFGICYFEIQWSKDMKSIAYLNHIPTEKLRRKKEIEGEYDGWKYSENWARTQKFTPIFFPEFTTDKNITKETSTKQIYCIKEATKGANVYSIPSYYGGLNYIVLDFEISRFKLNILKKGAKPDLIVKIKNMVPELEQRQKIVDDFLAKYQTQKDSEQVVFMFTQPGEEAPEIQTLNPSTNDKFLNDFIDVCQQKILNVWKIPSGEILGISSPGKLGQSSGMDQLMAEYRLQKNVIDKKQQLLENHLNYLAKINGVVEPIRFSKIIDEEKVGIMLNLFNPK